MVRTVGMRRRGVRRPRSSVLYNSLRLGGAAARAAYDAWLAGRRGVSLPTRAVAKKRRVAARVVTGERKRLYKAVPTWSGGTYKGSFKKSRKRRVKNLFRKLGVELTQEGRGTVNDTDVVGVAHGVAVGSIMLSVVDALWRKLYEHAGYDLCDWDAVPEVTADLFTVTYGWRDTVNSAVINTRSVAFVIADTHEDIGIKIRDDILNASVFANDTFVMEYIRIVPVAGTAVDKLIMGHLCTRNMTVSVRQTSLLVLQNRTPGAAATDDLVTDITNNPLTGRVWDFNYNNFMARGAYSGNAGLTLDPRFGGQSITVPTVAVAGIGNKVPGPSDLKYTTSTNRVLLNPGALKKSHLSFAMTLTINAFFSKIKNYLKNATGPTADTNLAPVFIGKSRVFMFEKMCDTGAGTQNATIGYELSSVYGAKIVRAAHTFTRRINYG